RSFIFPDEWIKISGKRIVAACRGWRWVQDQVQATVQEQDAGIILYWKLASADPLRPHHFANSSLFALVLRRGFSRSRLNAFLDEETTPHYLLRHATSHSGSPPRVGTRTSYVCSSRRETAGQDSPIPARERDEEAPGDLYGRARPYPGES